MLLEPGEVVSIAAQIELNTALLHIRPLLIVERSYPNVISCYRWVRGLSILPRRSKEDFLLLKVVLPHATTKPSRTALLRVTLSPRKFTLVSYVRISTIKRASINCNCSPVYGWSFNSGVNIQKAQQVRHYL